MLNLRGPTKGEDKDEHNFLDRPTWREVILTNSGKAVIKKCKQSRLFTDPYQEPPLKNRRSLRIRKLCSGRNGHEGIRGLLSIQRKVGLHAPLLTNAGECRGGVC